MDHRTSARLGSALVLFVLGCAPDPVAWDERRSLAGAVERAALSVDGTLRPDSMAAIAARIAPPPGPVCPGSLRLSLARATLYAVWWSVRPDSSALLRSARTADEGRSWSAPATVDSTDQGRTGCRRSPPSIAADSASGYVHVAYALWAREGPGLFFSHSMDAGSTFHEAVPIFYGERLGLASVASDGDVVAVAFEDPNSATPRVGLALSRTMGHIFEDRLLPVSEENGPAARPLTAVRGRRIAVAWERRPASDSAPAALAVRTGELR